MADFITIEIDPSEIRKLNENFGRILETSRKGVSDILQRLVLLAVQSAAKATPLAKARKHKKVSSWSAKKKKQEDVPSWANYRIEWWKKGEMEFVYTSRKSMLQKLKKPKYRGAAKAGWWGPLKGKFSKAKPPKAAREGGSQIKRTVGKLETKKLYNQLIEIEVTNLIDYINKVAPNSANIGLRNAMIRFNQTEKKKLEKKLEAKWKSLS